jgi:hypothetical protein
MAHNIEKRDIQAGIDQAWHGLTTIVDKVERNNSMPFEVVESPIYYKIQKPDQYGLMQDVMVQDPEFKTLLANDDWLPVGQPYGASYCPTSIRMFWEIISKGMGDTPYEIISAGTVDNRQKIFASLKVSDGFRVGDREFKDYITLLDSFDKSTSLQARYSNICVVCANTFAANMQSGTQIGKAKHTQMIEMNVVRLIEAIDHFSGTSSTYKAKLQEAFDTPCSRDEARSWLMGIEARNTDKLTNGLKQKIARQVELFDAGKGNEGRNRLDALSALTEFHSHESSNRKDDDAQYMASEWGASAGIKTLAATRLKADWDKHVKHGDRILSEDRTPAMAS